MKKRIPKNKGNDLIFKHDCIIVWLSTYHILISNLIKKKKPL